MKRTILAAALAGTSLALAGCGYDEGEYNNASYNAEGADYDANAAGDAYANGAAGADAYGNAAGAAAWPQGARIIVENGVTYRIDPDGTRIRLGDADSRILVEDGVRFRVDPDGTRVRIDDEGAVIAVDTDGVDADVNLGDDGSVSVNTN